MKRLILLLAALYISVGSLSAQSWLDALKGVASSAIDRATGGKLTANAIYGTWDYSQPGIKLSSEDDIISDLAASAATSTIQNKMAPYFEKVGIKAGVCKFTFNSEIVIVSPLVGNIAGRALKILDKTFFLSVVLTPMSFPSAS